MRSFLLAFTLLLLTTISFSQSVSVGKYTFRVDAINTDFRMIRGASITATVSDDFAIIQAEATGYQKGQKRVVFLSEQLDYVVKVVLFDPRFSIQAVDSKGKLVTTIVDRDQSEISDTSSFVFLMTVLEDGFTNFRRPDINVLVNSIDPVGEIISVGGHATYPKVLVALKRQSLKNARNTIQVKIPRDTQIGKSRALKFRTLHGTQTEAITP
jgi:hypothetical protein